MPSGSAVITTTGGCRASSPPTTVPAASSVRGPPLGFVRLFIQMPQAPGRKRDRGQMRLQVARRQVDHHSADPAGAHRGELGRDRFERPVHREPGARIELAKSAMREAGEIRPQQRATVKASSMTKRRRYQRLIRHSRASGNPEPAPGTPTLAGGLRGRPPGTWAPGPPLPRG
jgi:hypothetical protein